MAATAGGLAAEGELVIIGATVDPMPLVPLGLIMGGHRVVGHPSGTAADIEDTMNFAVLSGVRPRIEEMPLTEAAAAYARMDDGSARYRMVLTM
jgi:alcohol dehydrogenase